jgi:methyl acetate hydrolase
MIPRFLSAAGIAVTALPLLFASAVPARAAGASQTAAPARPVAAAATLSRDGASAIAAGLRAALARGDVPGAVVLVVSRDGVLVHEAAGKLDVARGVAMPKDAIFRIASMTKPITSLAALQLVEEGKLRLDDPVSKYLPDWAAPKVISTFDEASGRYATTAAERPITIQHLLTHTSGIGYAWSNPRLAVIQKTAGIADLELPLVHQPGARFTYGASTRVLGQVVERLTGLSIDAALEARVLGPLGMTETSFALPPAKHARLVTIQQRTGGRFVEQPNPSVLPPTVRGDGGLLSTAADYGRFLRMLLNEGTFEGRRIAAPQTIRAMTSNHLGGLKVERQPAADAARSKPYPLGAGADTWGLGFQLAAKPAAPSARGEGSYSWAGINNTHFWVDPSRRVGVVVLMQVLPFYDDAAIGFLTEIESLVNAHVR